MRQIDTSGMVPGDQLQGAGFEPEEVPAMRDLADEAYKFIAGFNWCKKVDRFWFDRGFSKVAVFYFQITPAGSADSGLWVIVGDIPPAYIVTDNAPNGAVALSAYIVEVEKWVEAARAGKPVDRLMPIVSRKTLARLSPTPEVVEMLESRIRFIEREVLSDWEDELA